MSVERPRQQEDYKYDRSDGAAINDAILQPRAAGGLRVGNAREGDHRVEREINSRQRSFEEVIEFLFCAEGARRGFIAHLDKIFQGEIGQSVGVLFSSREIFASSGSTLRPFGRMHRKPLTIRSLVRARPKFDDRMAPPAAATAIIFASSVTVSSDAATGWIREPFPVKDFRP
jgi:hypothetical protein